MDYKQRGVGGFFRCVRRLTKKQFDQFINKLDKDVVSAFSDKEITILAANSGYTMRTGGKISAKAFLRLVVFNAEELKKQTLSDCVATLSSEYDITVTRQSLNERFNKAAVQFLTTALQYLLKSQLDSPSALKEICSFNRILIKDSTCFGIDKSLKDVYPISDNPASTEAAVRIQFEYDVLSGKINDLSISSFRDQDNKNWIGTNILLQENDLIIRDLAYMHLKAISDCINNRNANVLCRLDTRTDVYILNRKNDLCKIVFSKEHKKMRKMGISQREFKVFVGTKERIPLRMVIYDMPDSIANERVRKTRRERKRNGSKSIRTETLARARLVIMLTNVTEHLLNEGDLYLLYGIRWQIELMFKAWKSLANIDKVKKVKRERFECYIFGRLLLIIMIWQFYWSVNIHYYKLHKIRLSTFKVYKRLLAHCDKLLKIHMGKLKERLSALNFLFNVVKHGCFVEIKKGDIDFMIIIDVVANIGNKYVISLRNRMN